MTEFLADLWSVVVALKWPLITLMVVTTVVVEVVSAKEAGRSLMPPLIRYAQLAAFWLLVTGVLLMTGEDLGGASPLTQVIIGLFIGGGCFWLGDRGVEWLVSTVERRHRRRAWREAGR